MGKDPRKDASKKAWRQQQEKKLVDSIPISQADLKELFNYLQRPGSPPCDSTLQDTIQFLEQKKLSVELVVQWLHEHGGHCDCEVVFNVEETFGPLIARSRRPAGK